MTADAVLAPFPNDTESGYPNSEDAQNTTLACQQAEESGIRVRSPLDLSSGTDTRIPELSCPPVRSATPNLIEGLSGRP